MLFSAMLDDITLDMSLQAHYEVQKMNTVCNVCHTRCGSAHASSSATTTGAVAPGGGSLPSQPGTPETKPLNLASGTGTGTNTPTNGKSDGTIYFECLNCKRQIASNRYAPHLSTCMGVGVGNRRGASRNTMVKPKMSAEPGRSTSPYLGSDAGNASDDSKNQSAKGKGKSKNTRKDDAEFNLHRKRTNVDQPGSPQISPKKSKKAKTTGSPLKISTEAAMPPPTSKKPSKSRAPSSTSDFIQDREVSVSASLDNESRLSVFSPEATPMTPTSSTDSRSNSISLTNGTGKSGSVKPNKTGAAKSATRSVTPSRLPPPPIHKMPDPSYMMDYEGEETGSSTDSESD